MTIAVDMGRKATKKTKTCVVGTQKNHLNEKVLLSTNYDPVLLSTQNTCLNQIVILCKKICFCVGMNYATVTFLVSIQADSAHYYGFVYFRQTKDRSIRRGYFQKVKLVILKCLLFPLLKKKSIDDIVFAFVHHLTCRLLITFANSLDPNQDRLMLVMIWIKTV